MVRRVLALTLSLLAAPAFGAEVRHMTLDEALALAAQQNPGIARSDAQVEQARALSRQALSLLLPSLTATGSYVRNSDEATLELGDLFAAVAAATGQPVPEDTPDTVTLQPLEAFNASATLRVPVFGPAAFSTYGAMRHRVEGAEAGAEAVRDGLRAAVIQTCWLEATGEGLVEAGEAILTRAKAYQQSAERAEAAGTGTHLAVLRAQTEVAHKQGDLVQAKASRDKARLAVGALLGLAEPVQVEMPAPQERQGADVDSQVERALASRPEVAAARAQVEAAQAQVRAEWLTLSPSIYAALTGFGSTVAYVTGEQTGWQASVNLSWTLYQGGLRTAKARQANAALRDAEAALAAQELQVSREVRGAVDDLAVAVERMALAERQLQLAEEAAAVAQRAFDAGTLGSTDLLDTLDHFDQARVGQVDATARLGVAIVALNAATAAW